MNEACSRTAAFPFSKPNGKSGKLGKPIDSLFSYTGLRVSRVKRSFCRTAWCFVLLALDRTALNIAMEKNSSGAPPKKLRKVEAGEKSDEAKAVVPDTVVVNEEDDSEYDEETQKILEDIDNCQNEIDTLNEQASEEILQIEQKYNKLRKPQYEKRSQMIEKIPHFWLTVFTNHPQISSVLSEHEEHCLTFLTNMEVEEYEDIKSGYRIRFFFSANPYFDNDVITKEFHLGTAGDLASQTTAIKWKPGVDLIKKCREKSKKNIGFRSFFSWLVDHKDPTTDDIAEVIKEDVWPNPLQYFLMSDMSVENGEEESDEEEGDEHVVDLGDENDDDEEEDFGAGEGDDDE